MERVARQTVTRPSGPSVTRSFLSRSLRMEGDERSEETTRVRDREGRSTDNQGRVCKVGTQDPENLDEELKPLVTVWSARLVTSSLGAETAPRVMVTRGEGRVE